MSRLPPPSLSTMEITTSSELTPTKLGFPNEFPYEFDSPAFTPGFTSPGDSTETEDESSDDEEDFLAGLTRRLAPSTQRNTKPEEEKRQVAASSPQSTLSGLGSFTIHPTTSFRRDNAWDVISAAAGEVAKLKMSQVPRQNAAFQADQSPKRKNGAFQVQAFQQQDGAFQADLALRHQNGAFQANQLLQQQNGAFQANQLLQRQNGAFQADQSLQRQRFDQMWYCSQSRIKSSENLFPNRETVLENLKYIRRNTISTTATWQQPQGTPLKRPSAGTGVFLPRRYPTTTESCKKPHVSTGGVNGRVMMQSKVNQFDYECMIARSRLVAATRERNLRSVLGDGCLIQERCLPQDWMY